MIAQKRVLRPKNDACRAELDDAFEKTAQVRQEIMEVLLTTGGRPGDVQAWSTRSARR